MIKKLKELKTKYLDLTEKVSDPAVLADQNVWKKLVKEHSSLTPIIEKYDEYVKTEKDMQDAKTLKQGETDHDMLAMLDEEFYVSKEKLNQITEELKVLLLPRDENDDKNVIIEIRAGAGGDEASLFASELKRMYSLYAESKKWKTEEIDGNYNEAGGIKEVSFMIKGNGAFSKMKFESGVHRVQRVPVTEAQGRVHTSTATVAVLPESTDIEIEINDKDLQVDTYRSSGAGGQHVNKTESAIRITHIPTGIVVACQEERSQIKNREKAMHYLKNKLYDLYQTQADEEYARRRRTQIGTGDRSEKIRTYNFPQNRVTDHRISYTMYNLSGFMDGDLSDMIRALAVADQQARLTRG